MYILFSLLNEYSILLETVTAVCVFKLKGKTSNVLVREGSKADKCIPTRLGSWEYYSIIFLELSWNVI
jgi:hypothetical protein